MKRKGIILLIVSLLAVVSGCSVRKAANMANCNYTFQKVTGLTWAGIDFMKVGSEFEKLDFSTITSCVGALVRKDFALSATMDIKATNPGKREAALAGFDYILYYDGKQVGQGESVNEKDIIVRGEGGSTVIPVTFTLDFSNLVNIKQPKESVQNVVGLIKDVSKLGKQDTRFSAKIRPRIRMGGSVVNGPFINIGKI